MLNESIAAICCSGISSTAVVRFLAHRFLANRYASQKTCQPSVAHEREPVYNGPSIPMPCLRPLRPSSLLPIVFISAMATNAYASGPVDLHWSAPDECPSSADVLAEVDRLLGARTTIDPHVIDVVASVKKKKDGTFVVRLEIPSSDGPRSRQVSASSCAALGRATALILAMIVDPEAALSAPPGNSGSSGLGSGGEAGKTIVEPGPPAQIFTQPVRFDAPLRLPYVRPLDDREGVALIYLPRISRFSVVVQFLGDFGALPGPAGGIGVGFGAFAGRWRLEAGADYLGEKTSSYSALPKAGAVVGFLGGHAAFGIGIPLHATVEIVPRVRLDIGRFSGTSFGVSDVGQGMAFATSVGAGAMLAVRVAQSLCLKLGLDGLVFIDRPKFIVEGLGPAHEPSTFVARPALGAEVQF